MESYHFSTVLLPLAKSKSQWEEEYSYGEAQRELQRARIRGIARGIRRLLFRDGRSRQHPIRFEPRPNASFLLPIDLVAGVVDAMTGRRPHLRSRLAVKLWHRFFNRDTNEDYPPLLVTQTAAGWHLTGGTAALVELEVMRSKGHREVRVAMAPKETGEQTRAACDVACPETAA